ncbi:putative Chitin binding Peritrophin-A domain-containing protein 35 [Homarus americanus]|uniref:Putative Chitin binding Peritrophin-A domain-containing protein 35 n=1 Tax=Homarus americanus TaxID=6706 RepID=A0A8J5N7K9_HOMAM|nr:putative Chitin binding Peritrophin-A domain-containing protein 35 [Homarus americanus]
MRRPSNVLILLIRRNVKETAPYPTPQTTSVEEETTTDDPDETTQFLGETLSPFETTLSSLNPMTEVPDVETTTAKTWVLDEYSAYDCPAPGYYPFEGDCFRFYRCFETPKGTLKGLLYKCPTGYNYSLEHHRCAKEDSLPPCMKKLQAAHLRLAGVIQLSKSDLSWFFDRDF